MIDKLYVIHPLLTGKIFALFISGGGGGGKSCTDQIIQCPPSKINGPPLICCESVDEITLKRHVAIKDVVIVFQINKLFVLPRRE